MNDLWIDRNNLDLLLSDRDIDEYYQAIVNMNEDIQCLKEDLTKLELVSCPLYVDPINSCQLSVDRMKYLKKSEL